MVYLTKLIKKDTSCKTLFFLSLYLMKLNKAILLSIIAGTGFVATAAVSAQTRMTREEYILMYKDIAIDQMISSGIPASITLAQGCLESGNGNSRLAVEGNNHFGIKCHGWAGDSIAADDDRPQECFRKYESAEQSFRDHSDFLRYRDRYAGLFELQKDDYKGWAHGLKAAGYATSPTYAENLIRIIEENNLFLFDRLSDTAVAEMPPAPAVAEAPVEVRPDKGSPHYRISLNRQVYSRNGVHYILAEGYDTFASIADEYNLFRRELLRFNDLKEERRLNAGDVIYLEHKRSQGAKHLDKHVVEEGETLYDLSQRYAIRLKKLSKMNNMSPEAGLSAGSIIILRK